MTQDKSTRQEKLLEQILQQSNLSDPYLTLNPEAPDLPYFSFDLDGVICRPPLGMNQVLGRKLHLDELPETVRLLNSPPTSAARKNYLKMRGLFETVKYFGRKPMPLAREGIIEICNYRTPLIITGRSFLAHRVIEIWLAKYNMNQYFAGIYPNNTALRTRKYKLHMLRRLNIGEHADDDGEITHYLAMKGIPHLYLRDWSRNAGLPYPDHVVHFTYLSEIAQDLAKLKK
ncbi:MAG: hypothetical protein WCS37_17400 [Chloroflexota bacterium]|nr:hypothetical protein [Chloroflexota bacterium]